MGQEVLQEAAWNLLLCAAAIAGRLQDQGVARLFGTDSTGTLVPLDSGSNDAVLAWLPGSGWQLKLSPADPRFALIDLYLPVCGATAAHPITVGHLGQSLDGFIATPTGDSQFVTGAENIMHLHRMRALCDAVVVGAGTVVADDPQLTTRQVTGPNPLRVVFDPTRRLSSTYRLFNDDAAPTLYICAKSLMIPGERFGSAEVVGFDDEEPGREVAQVSEILRKRGCARIFVEGGGVTVSAFLEADLLDRLQMAIAPLLIGDGRPAIRLAPHANLRDCRRPRYRVFRMGGDVLFDCELGANADTVPDSAGMSLVSRVI